MVMVQLHVHTYIHIYVYPSIILQLFKPWLVLFLLLDRDAVKALESQVRSQRQSCGERVRMSLHSQIFYEL